MRAFWIFLIVLQIYHQSAFCLLENPEYWLYTRANPNAVKFRTPNKTQLLQSTFSFNKPTWFITHGWVASGNTPMIQDLKNAYLNNWDVNIIVVDWGATANNFYTFVRFSIEEISGRFYELVKFMVDNGYSLDNVNMVGHSLGAHISGLVAKKLGNELIASITGVDPAYPWFYFVDDKSRLSPNDAKYVEVIHSNAGFAGYLGPIGDVDIYINGGTFQPECGFDIFKCPHERGFMRYVETIKNNRDYMAYRCTGLDTATRGACTKDVALKIGGSLPKPWIGGLYWVSTITDW